MRERGSGADQTETGGRGSERKREIADKRKIVTVFFFFLLPAGNELVKEKSE